MRSWSLRLVLSLALLFAGGACSAKADPQTDDADSGGTAGRAVIGGEGGEPEGGGPAMSANGGSAGGGGHEPAGGGTTAGGGTAGQVSAGGSGGQLAMGGGMAGVGGTAGAVVPGTGGSVAEIPDGSGVFFSGKQETLSKLVASDGGPGYMSLSNGVTVQVHQEIPIEVKPVSDAALPARTKYALSSLTAKPGAVNLIWSINLRADKSPGGTRADWQGFDASGFEAVELYMKASHAKKFVMVAYSGTTGHKATGDMVSSTSWKRVRIHLRDGLRFGPGPLDLAALGRVDLVMSVENNNPPLEWWLTGIRFLNKAQYETP